MDDEQNPEALATELEREANKLDRKDDELGADIDSVRQDWHRKRAENIPGTPPEPADREGPPEPATEPPSDGEDSDESDHEDSDRDESDHDDSEEADSDRDDSEAEDSDG